MLNPKKVIPALAASVLAIAGCSSSDGNTGGTSGSGGSGGSGGTGGSAGTGGTAGMGGGLSDGLANALNAFCVKYVDCFPNDYANAEECTNYISQYYALDGSLTPECESAAISYFDCGALLSCADLDMESNSCDDEATAAEQACGV